MLRLLALAAPMDGTRVDGEMLHGATAPLRAGARIELGRHRLLFERAIDPTQRKRCRR